MKIGNLNLAGRVLAAPLAGVSNRPFRVLAVACGAGMTYTEMVSSEGIIRHQRKTLAMLRFQPDERPLGIQLFGARPGVMGEAAAIVVEQFKPDLIDLNFGCPVKKVVNKNGGAAVLKDLGLTRAIIAAVVDRAGEVPVTIKIRSGWDQAHPVYIDAGRIAEETGAQAVTLHARSRSGGFSVRADWSAIKRLKDAVGITVIGNGDVRSPEDARRMLDETNCDGVMIGRASMGDPSIFARINHYLETGALLPLPSLAETVATVRRHTRLMVEVYGEISGPKMMRKHFGWYFRGFGGASALRQRLLGTKTAAEIENVLDELLQMSRPVS
jgi:tRNA-dihydrouridine synthase B